LGVPDQGHEQSHEHGAHHEHHRPSRCPTCLHDLHASLIEVSGATRESEYPWNSRRQRIAD
jgi:hypothetical protein